MWNIGREVWYGNSVSWVAVWLLLYACVGARVCVHAFWATTGRLDWLTVRCQNCRQQINLEQPFCPLDKVHLPPKALISFTHSVWREEKWGERDTAGRFRSESFLYENSTCRWVRGEIYPFSPKQMDSGTILGIHAWNCFIKFLNINHMASVWKSEKLKGQCYAKLTLLQNSDLLQNSNSYYDWLLRLNTQSVYRETKLLLCLQKRAINCSTKTGAGFYSLLHLSSMKTLFTLRSSLSDIKMSLMMWNVDSFKGEKKKLSHKASVTETHDDWSEATVYLLQQAASLTQTQEETNWTQEHGGWSYR